MLLFKCWNVQPLNSVVGLYHSACLRTNQVNFEFQLREIKWCDPTSEIDPFYHGTTHNSKLFFDYKFWTLNRWHSEYNRHSIVLAAQSSMISHPPHKAEGVGFESRGRHEISPFQFLSFIHFSKNVIQRWKIKKEIILFTNSKH